MMMRTQQHGDDRRQGKVPECNGGDLGERCVIVHDPAGDENVRAGGRVRRMGPQSGSQARARACLAALTARNRSIRELLPQVGVSQGTMAPGKNVVKSNAQFRASAASGAAPCITIAESKTSRPASVRCRAR